MTEVSKGPVEAGGSANYEQCLDIPPLPPSNLANCRIIDLEYNLKVEACVEGWLVFLFAVRCIIRNVDPAIKSTRRTSPC